MQPQRSVQRRSPAADPGRDPGPPPTVPARSMSPNGPGAQSRTSSSASKMQQNGGSRRQNNTQSSQSSSANPPLSQIEKSVTHLLVATKQLLETLTQWSRHLATDAQVSDVYVRLGYEFNIACRAFSAIHVDITDLGNVPELLRTILESTLSQEASVESLERYLPRIRDIIINLLHGLKRKQQKLRQKQTRDGASANGDQSIPRNGSVNSVASGNTGLTTLLDQGIANNYQGSDSDGRENAGGSETNIPPRSSSSMANRKGLPTRVNSRESLSSDGSTISSSTMQRMPVLAPYPSDEAPLPVPPSSELENFPPPPPPPKQQNQQNVLAALQQGGSLNRRASMRISTFDIRSQMGGTNGIPNLPLPQNSPAPNRGRNDGNDARESIRAVQARTNKQHIRQKSSRLQTEVSPTRVRSQILEEGRDAPELAPPADAPADDSPMVKTPEDKLRRPVANFDAPSATLQGPPSDALPILSEPEKDNEQFPEPPKHATSIYPESTSTSTVRAQTPQGRLFTPEPPSPPDKELTLFLQYRTRVKKLILPDGFNELSVSRLQLAFMEKFSWNVNNNGIELPEILIQDPVSGVRYEIDDIKEVKDRTVLVLNYEPLDEVKRHIDEGLGGIKRVVEGLRSAVDDQQTAIARVSDRQRDAAKEISRLAAAPPAPIVNSSVVTRSSAFNSAKLTTPAQLSEVQSIKRDLAVVRQTFTNFQSEIQNSMTTIRKTASSVKAEAAKALVPSFDDGSGRAYVDEKRRKMEDENDSIIVEVNDLQDLTEELRKDVVTRGVRPLPRQLESAAKDLARLTMALKKSKVALEHDTPLFNKIWTKELEKVAEDQEAIKEQRLINKDLEADLEEVAGVLALVEQCTKEQLKDAPGAMGTRNLSQTLRHVGSVDPAEAKEGVLGQVRALQPNHTSRLEAIERAEKQRQKDLESRRGDEFQKELGSFVEEGKLKKTGGYEEVERARLLKDERIRREVMERAEERRLAAERAAEEPVPEEPAEESAETADDGDAAQI